MMSSTGLGAKKTGLFRGYGSTRVSDIGYIKTLAGRVESDREVFKISRVGSGRVESGGFKYHGSSWVTLTRNAIEIDTRSLNQPFCVSTQKGQQCIMPPARRTTPWIVANNSLDCVL